MVIAQLVERWIVAPEVAGSSPSYHPTSILLININRLIFAIYFVLYTFGTLFDSTYSSLLANLAVMPLEYPLINDIVVNAKFLTGSIHLTPLTPLLDFTTLTTELGFVEDFTKLCADLANNSAKLDEIEEDFSAYIEMEMRRREKRFPHLTRDQI